MRIKNITPDLYARHFIAITARDCLVIARLLAARALLLAGIRHCGQALA